MFRPCYPSKVGLLKKKVRSSLSLTRKHASQGCHLTNAPGLIYRGLCEEFSHNSYISLYL